MAVDPAPLLPPHDFYDPPIPMYEARIAALERLVGRQALELEFLKVAAKSAPRSKSATTSVVIGPRASGSRRLPADGYRPLDLLLQRRLAEGHSKLDAIRALKRYLAIAQIWLRESSVISSLVRGTRKFAAIRKSASLNQLLTLQPCFSVQFIS
jgi:hypothetical protein